MPVTLTGTSLNFNDGTQQFSAAGSELLLRSNIASGVMTFDYTGMYDAGFRNRYQSLHVSLTDVFSVDSAPYHDYCLQFRWTDGAGNYGWADTSTVPYRYPNLRYMLQGLNFEGVVSSTAASTFGDNKIIIGREHGSISGGVDIYGLGSFDCEALFHCYGVHNAGHMMTFGSAKVENRSGFSRVLDGFRLFIFGGTTALAGGTICVYGVRR